jgi:SDR family mycofactocin-dependent oxidoreductase
MSGRVQGKVALVTGAARGQGRAEAVRLAEQGADVIVVDVCAPLPEVDYDSATPEDLDETVRLIEKTGRRAASAVVDERDLPGLRAAVDAAIAEFGHLDVVVANAGICIPRPWNETTPEIYEATISTNVTGVWNTVMVSAPHLITAGGGSIVLTSSYAGKKMQPFMVHYTASKHAVTGMTRAFAAELGKHNIRVNSVHPGAVNTPMGSGDMIARIQATNETNPPLAAMGTPFLPKWSAEASEIADAVAFLVSDEARFITAEHLSIDAGAQYF